MTSCCCLAAQYLGASETRTRPWLDGSVLELSDGPWRVLVVLLSRCDA